MRRGDYLVDQQATAHFGVLGPDHYAAARQALEARVPAPTYFLFSDEPERARTELATWPDLRPVAGLSGPEDLRLMSLCRHFIIANSTFSWWGRGWVRRQTSWLSDLAGGSDRNTTCPSRSTTACRRTG
ncbi:MAG: alpha-1,2-fucosyltransferase [Devosia sp.]|nr:alpha-1,2-fucosyltransferase [Devosia sp.]